MCEGNKEVGSGTGPNRRRMGERPEIVAILTGSNVREVSSISLGATSRHIYRARLRMAQIDVGEKGGVWEDGEVREGGVRHKPREVEREVQGCADSSSRKKSDK